MTRTITGREKAKGRSIMSSVPGETRLPEPKIWEIPVGPLQNSRMENPKATVGIRNGMSARLSRIVVKCDGLLTLPSLTLGQDVYARMQSAVVWSFVIGLTVSSLDILAGIPLAWLIVRRPSHLTPLLDSLADIPFLIPTVALGFSVLEFWSGPTGISQIFGSGSLVSPGTLLIMLLHFAFSFPVIVRVMVGEFLNYRETYEVAARTLGASAFT